MTHIYLVCMDHDPMICSYDEIHHHISVDTVKRITQIISERKKYLENPDITETIIDSHSDPILSRSVRFMHDHPTCSIGLMTEYKEWIDVGHGLPSDPSEIKLWKDPIRERVEKINYRLQSIPLVDKTEDQKDLAWLTARWLQDHQET